MKPVCALISIIVWMLSIISVKKCIIVIAEGVQKGLYIQRRAYVVYIHMHAIYDMPVIVN